MDSVFASHTAAPSSVPGVPDVVPNVAEVNRQRCCLEQWTSNTLDGGKLVLQKSVKTIHFCGGGLLLCCPLF